MKNEMPIMNVIGMSHNNPIICQAIEKSRIVKTLAPPNGGAYARRALPSHGFQPVGQPRPPSHHVAPPHGGAVPVWACASNHGTPHGVDNTQTPRYLLRKAAPTRKVTAVLGAPVSPYYWKQREQGIQLPAEFGFIQIEAGDGGVEGTEQVLNDAGIR